MAESAKDHPRGAIYADTMADLTAIFEPETQVCVHPRPRIPEIEGYLAEPALGSWRGLRQVANRRAEADWRPTGLPLPPGQGREALARDLLFLMELYADLLGCPRLGLRLESLDRAMCPGWHRDRTGIRLLCTYRGPGTEWLDDTHQDLEPLNAPDRAEATGRAKAFDIVLLKGTLWQGNGNWGAIHRSPEPDGARRVLFALDALW
jgi:hypothetical protein